MRNWHLLTNCTNTNLQLVPNSFLRHIGILTPEINEYPPTLQQFDPTPTCSLTFHFNSFILDAALFPLKAFHMKNLAVLFCLTSLFSSCADVNTSDQLVDSEPLETSPGRVPIDHPVNSFLLVNDIDWQDLLAYYHTIESEKDEKYFNNLQWKVLSTLVDRTSFLQEADLESMHFLLNEMLNRHFINEPLSYLKLLHATVTDTNSKRNYTQLIIQKNRDYLTASNFQRHQKTHSRAYTEIARLSYNRWGQPLPVE